MENPYEKYDAHRNEPRYGHGAAWGFTLVFLLVITLAPFWQNVNEAALGSNGWTPVIEIFRYSPDQGPLTEHLRQAEKKIEDAPFTKPPRRWMQALLTGTLREGNRQAAIGSDGWLFFRPAIDALTGYGPLKPEPDTVAKDPNREPWRGPLDAIVRFNAQLESYGVELILVPIPVKPMIHPEQIGARSGEAPLQHRDAEAFYAKLRESGVEILDLSADWFARKGTEPVFLKQDTHWTPQTMQASAGRVADFLRKRPWFTQITTEAGRFALGAPVTVTAPGDLLEKLDLPDGNGAFEPETATITPVTDTKGGAMSVYDPASPIVLLGDSFTNIFHQADMKWGENAGFAEHLSHALGLPLDTIAQNGQASTGVRRTLATRADAERLMREKKKAVVWAIAARDLFLSETAAVTNGVRWDDVNFRTGDPAKDVRWPVELEATVTETARYQDPKSAPYDASLFAVEYRVDRVLSGDYALDQVLALHWAFRNRTLTPDASLKPGDQVRLTLEAFEQASTSDETLRGANKATGTTHEFDLPMAWASGVHRLTGARGETAAAASADQASRLASIATGIFGLGLGLVLWLVFRHKRALRAARN
ncbi:MAG: hypothetical protein JNK37_09875 [Verrucomicrobiales bacterium]|nr:hypothetical protein [Verrucomicrobiales bacterium]